MAVPIWVRSVAAVFGGLLVLVVWANVIKTLIVPRPVTHGLAIRVVRLVNKAFRLAANATADYPARDRCARGRPRRSCWPRSGRGWAPRSSGSGC
jgi:hypothetical protein